ncbi:phage portal protein [bacterium]|nr:phage portal protein [bacterium]
MIQYEEDEQSTNIEISNVADWMKFNSPATSNSNDPFLVEGEEILKLNGLGPSFRRKVSRDIQKRFTGTDGAGTQQLLIQQAVSGYALFDLVQPEYNLDYLSTIYEISPYNYAAINAKVSNIVGLGFDFIESRKTTDMLDSIDDEKQLERARRKLNRIKQDLHQWLEDCNEEETFKETLIKFYTDVEATGNGYLEVGRTTNGKIGYIGHIPSKTMRVRRLRDGFVQLLYGKAVFFRNFGDTETANPIAGSTDRPNEIIHLKKYTPKNNYYGIPDIIAAQSAMAGNEFAGKYNLDYFENKAVPRYIITVKGAKLSTESERKLLEFFQVGLKGKNHRSLYIPLPPDSPDSKVEFKMEPIEAGQQESSFNVYRTSNRDEILMAHRVPINKIGTATGISLANARDADKTFKEQVCAPAQDILEKKLNKIIEEMTDALTLKFNELSLTDADTQSKIDERYLRLQVITPNEIRVRMGMVPRDGGDEVVDLQAQAAEIKAQAMQSRARDGERAANSPDNSGEGRNAKGDGRQVE